MQALAGRPNHLAANLRGWLGGCGAFALYSGGSYFESAAADSVDAVPVVAVAAGRTHAMRDMPQLNLL